MRGDISLFQQRPTANSAEGELPVHEAGVGQQYIFFCVVVSYIEADLVVGVFKSVIGDGDIHGAGDPGLYRVHTLRKIQSDLITSLFTEGDQADIAAEGSVGR